MIYWRLFVTALVILAVLYYISIALHCFGLINITSKNVTFLKSIIPFYYWVRG